MHCKPNFQDRGLFSVAVTLKKGLSVQMTKSLLHAHSNFLWLNALDVKIIHQINESMGPIHSQNDTGECS